MRLDRTIAAIAVSLALATPAAASGGIFCENDKASVEIALSRMSVVQVLGALISVGDQSFSTGPERGEGTPIATGQAFGEGDSLMFDFVDADFMDILISVRLNFRPENEDYPWAGTVKLKDGKPVAIECGAD